MHTFSLYAPTATAVSCRCSAWSDAAKPMLREPDGTWTLRVDLPEGIHSYAYELNSRSWFEPGKQVVIPDPMTRLLTADEKASLVQIPARNMAEQYVWKHDAVEHPAHEHLAIYELFVQDFHGPNGTFERALEKLPLVAELGFTALEIMPLMGCDGKKSWGYTPCYFFAVEPRFGSEADLCHLVDEAHGKGMAVFFDGVYNHASRDCPLTHIDHDCYFHRAPKDPNVAWGPQFNYALSLPGTAEFPARHFIKQKVSHWITRFHFDGIRYDAISQFRDRDFLYELVDWTRDLAGEKPFFSIVECLPVEQQLVGPAGAMDACWQEEFMKRMRRMLSGEWDGDALEACFDCRRDGFLSGKDVVNYLGSHDTGHTMRHLLDSGLDEETALRRLMVGFTVLFTAMGIPMVWMGDEFGAMDGASQQPQPLPWHLLRDQRRQHLRQQVKQLLELRHHCAALRGDDCAVLLRDDAQRLIVIHRWDSSGGRILVAIHAGDGTATAYCPAPAAGTWGRLGDGHLIAVSEDNLTLQLDLEPWHAQVLAHQPVICLASA